MPGRGSIFCWSWIRTGRTESWPAAAERAGLRLNFLTQYSRLSGGAGAHTLVVRYPGLEGEKMAQGLERLAELL